MRQSARPATVQLIPGHQDRNYAERDREMVDDRGRPVGHLVLPEQEQAAREAAREKDRQLMRQARSSAYWFAAAKWGMGGMLGGMILGATMMYAAIVGASPVITDIFLQRDAWVRVTEQAPAPAPLTPIAPGPRP